MDNALCMFEMILSPYGGREVCFSPLRAMSTRRFPIESYISVVWRRPTAPGMTGPCHIHHNPPHLSQAQKTDRRIGMLLQPFSAGKRRLQPLGYTRSLHHDWLRRIFSPRVFLAGYLHSRAQCCFWWQIAEDSSNLRFCPDVDGPRARSVLW